MLVQHDRPEGSTGVPSGPGEASAYQPRLDVEGLSGRLTRLVNDDIELSRRAIPVQTVEPDVCSICLDSFTADDPGKLTACGHPYHLQCIMQWAQRSRECPLCFKPLVMQEHELNELLPFGEFIPQDGRLPGGISPQMWMGLDAWELERLLARLHTANQANTAPDRRRIRLRPRFRNLSLQPTADDGKFLGEGPSGEGVEAAGGSIFDFRRPREGASSSRHDAANGSIPSSPISAPWSSHSPSHSAAVSPRTPDSSGCTPTQLSRSANSADFQASGDTLKSRWGAMSSRCRETFNRTTRDLRNRLTKPSPQPSSLSMAGERPAQDSQANGPR